MNPEIEYVDRPRPGLMVWGLLLFFGLAMAFWWFVLGGVEPGLREFLRAGLTLFHVGMAVTLVWVNASTSYGWTADGLVVRQDWRSRVVPFAEIDHIEEGSGAGEFMVDGYANRAFRRLIIHVTEGRNVVITPTNPEEMRDEILRRRDTARSNSR
ncbi:MAG: hypothetical protein HOH95_09595 [Dehalococcoidia bacterium]|jgi:hypothetical protein|nr:hypothetical protein [Dehalococcoidia bacterium]